MNEYSLNLNSEEIKKISSVLGWVKVGCAIGKDDLLLIEKILYKIRLTIKSTDSPELTGDDPKQLTIFDNE